MTKQEWYEGLRKSKLYSWCTDDQWECCQLIFDLVYGDHHLYGKIKPFGFGIEYNTGQDLSTYDFNHLTRLVFMAHDRMIRVSVMPSGPGMIKIACWKRQLRDGDIVKSHPNLAMAISEYRKNNPLSEVKL